jgi:hypothetical protein
MRTSSLIGALLALSSALVRCGSDDATSMPTSGSSAGSGAAGGVRKAPGTPDGGSKDDMPGPPMMKMMGRDMNER